MFRFRRLLATPKSVNVEGGVEGMSSATVIHVVFHSVKQEHINMELDMTLDWHEDQLPGRYIDQDAAGVQD